MEFWLCKTLLRPRKKQLCDAFSNLPIHFFESLESRVHIKKITSRISANICASLYPLRNPAFTSVVPMKNPDNGEREIFRVRVGRMTVC